MGSVTPPMGPTALSDRWTPKNFETSMACIHMAMIRMGNELNATRIHRNVATSLVSAMEQGIKNAQGVKDRQGRDTGYTYQSKTMVLENIGSTYVFGHIVYQLLMVPIDGVPIYELLPVETNRLVVDPRTRMTIAHAEAVRNGIETYETMPRHYTQQQADLFIRLRNMPAFQDYNFAKHDHQAVADILRGIGDLPILEGDTTAIVIYNIIRFIVRMGEVLWFDNGNAYNLGEHVHRPGDQNLGIDAHYEVINFVNLSLIDQNSDILATVGEALRIWTSSVVHLELLDVIKEYSTLQYTGDILTYGYTIPLDFIEKYVSAIIDGILTLAKYSVIFSSEGHEFFEGFVRASLLNRAMALDPQIAAAIGVNVEQAMLFGDFTGTVDCTPTTAKTFLELYYSRTSNMMTIWKSFLERFYYKPDEKAKILPVITGLKSLNGSQMQVYSIQELPPYDTVTTKLNTYPEGSVLCDDMYKQIATSSSRVIDTGSRLDILAPADGIRVDTSREWDRYPQLETLIRRQLSEYFCRVVNTDLTEVLIERRDNGYLLIPPVHVLLDEYYPIFDDYQNNPHTWNVQMVNLNDIDRLLLAFVFKLSEINALGAIDTISFDTFKQLHNDRISYLKSGEPKGYGHLVIIPPLVRAPKFTWSTWVAAGSPKDASKLMNKIRVDIDYTSLLNGMPRDRVRAGEGNVCRIDAASVIVPREMIVAYPLRLDELDNESRIHAINHSPNYNNDGIIHYHGGRVQVRTGDDYADFMPGYVIAESVLTIDKDYWLQYGDIESSQNPNTIEYRFGSPFTKVDERLRHSYYIGRGTEEDMYDPYPPELNDIETSFHALAGCVTILATAGRTSFFGPTHGIFYYCARNLRDIGTYWLTLNQAGIPSTLNIRINGAMRQINHNYQAVMARAQAVIDSYNAETRSVSADQVGLLRTALFEFIRNQTNENDNIYYGEYGFVIQPLYFGSLLDLLYDRRHRMQRGLKFEAKGIGIYNVNTPVMITKQAADIISSYSRHFLTVMLENFIHFEYVSRVVYDILPPDNEEGANV